MESKPEQRGVNLVGYVRAESGVGQIGRSLAATLEAAGVPYTVIPFDLTRSRQRHPFDVDRGDGALYDTNIICINADQLPIFAAGAGRELLQGRYSIGVWAWEVDVLPEPMRPSGALVDEVWGISRHAADCIAPWVDCPVRAFPLAVEPPVVAAIDEAALDLPDGFRFLFCFDYDSVFERKNPIGLVKAYRRAFEPCDGACLVIKTINSNHHPTQARELEAAVSERADIRLIESYFDVGEYLGLVSACDAYASLHRAEGFGLTIAEAMALGKPVVATAYSASLDLMTENNSFPVLCELVPVGDGCSPYSPNARWAAPDIDHASRQLRRVFEHPEASREVGERACREIAELHGPAARAAQLRAELDRVWRLLRPGAEASKQIPSVPGSTPPRLEVEVTMNDLQRLIDAGPDPKRATAYGAVARWARRLVLRMVRILAFHQQEVDRGLLQRIDGTMARTEVLAEELENLRRSLQRLAEKSAILSSGRLGLKVTEPEEPSGERSEQVDRRTAESMVANYPHWYHRIELPQGFTTPGCNDSRAVLEQLDDLGLPEDCRGLRVLDLGCRDGFFAFEMERRGADVVPVDYVEPDITGFGIAAKLIGSEISHITDNVYNLEPSRYGTFDVVLFLGVLYHLRNPMLALDRVRSVTKDGGQLFLETQLAVEPTILNLPRPAWQFISRGELSDDPTNTWAPNLPGLCSMVEECEFEGLHSVQDGNRALIRAVAISSRQIKAFRSLDSADKRSVP